MFKNFNFRCGPTIVLLMLCALPVLWESAASAQEASDPLVRRAILHLSQQKNAEGIFSALHFGATMDKSTIASLHGLKDQDGNVLEGAFAIKVVYDWDTPFGANVTTATFFYDKDGYVTDITAKSTSSFSPPFEISKGTIQVLGELFIAIAKETGASAKDLTEMRQLVSDADSVGLLKASMNLKLLAGK